MRYILLGRRRTSGIPSSETRPHATDNPCNHKVSSRLHTQATSSSVSQHFASSLLVHSLSLFIRFVLPHHIATTYLSFVAEARLLPKHFFIAEHVGILDERNLLTLCGRSEHNEIIYTFSFSAIILRHEIIYAIADCELIRENIKLELTVAELAVF